MGKKAPKGMPPPRFKKGDRCILSSKGLNQHEDSDYYNEKVIMEIKNPEWSILSGRRACEVKHPKVDGFYLYEDELRKIEG